jgi:hypothetical protein
MLSPPPCNAISLQSKYRLDCRAVHSLGESIFLSSPPPGGGCSIFPMRRGLEPVSEEVFGECQ